MPLPSALIDRLFERLSVRYGSSWSAKWAGLDGAAVKADWANTLEGFESNTAAIQYGIVNLPLDFPPNAVQFREICQRRPEPNPVALPAPKADPAKVAEALAKVSRLQRNIAGKTWAHRLQEAEKSGASLTASQRLAWRDALRSGGDDRELFATGNFNPVPVEFLPPAMRPDAAVFHGDGA